jgi:probable DNA repair protein
MPSQPPLHTAVFAELDRGTLVLTTNQRAAHTLHGVYAQRMRAEGRTSWQPPPIFAWESWIGTLWQQLLLSDAETRILLSPMQERLLWVKILAEDAASRTLRSPASLSTLASDAWKLLAQYGGLDANGGLGRLRVQFEAASTDTRTFLRWAQQFERRCRKDLLLPSAQLDTALIPHVAKRALSVNASEIVLVGFDRMTPAQAALCEALRDAGVAVSAIAPAEAPRKIHILETADDASEMLSTARAIRKTLAADPQARLAVIVPDVASVRSKLERIFLGELAPELLTAGARAQRPFEFSLGLTLNRIAMTRAALSLLRWTVSPLPLEELSALVLSPYLAGAQSERYARAVWDAQQLRRAHLLEPEISLAWVLQQTQLPPLLLAQLSAVVKLIASRRPDSARGKKPAIASYAFWMDHAAALLDAGGWPGRVADRLLDSTEFQLQERWQELLDEVATLDFAGEAVDFATALAAIESAAAEILFAPQSHNAPVQIMGALESAGSAFDSIWFLGATDMAWPPASGTHPFIPWTVQRDLAMPGADAAHTLANAIGITQRIAASAPETIFSFARHGSEGEQRPSTCLRALDGAEWLQSDGREIAPPAVILLEDAADDTALPALPETAIRGGAAILKLQAMCPFRAFAERRLNSAELDSVEAGLDSGERGDLIHRVMAGFWSKIKTRQALYALPPEGRIQALNGAIHSALTAQRADTPWQRRYLDVQRAWLLELLPSWLEQELDRPPFQVIRTEQDLGERSIGPLLVKLRVDRIDAMLSDDRELTEDEKDRAPEQIILDYKTGNIGSKPWDGARPDEPQLPLYAVLADDRPIRGIAFARLKAGKMELQQSAGAGFAARVAGWRDMLTALATGFAQGDTTVDPKRNDTCKHCAMMGLCRIREIQYLSDDGDASDA